MSMPFSSDEQVKRSYDFFNKVDKPTCTGCKRGIVMCMHVPCIGTPDDMERLMDAGYAKNMSLDFWAGVSTKEGVLKKSVKMNDLTSFEEDVLYLSPSIVGSEGKLALFNKSGTCSLLIDNQCSVHHIKPTQGQYACCKIDNMFMDTNGKQEPIDERVAIIHTWNTQRGKDIIERWKSEVNYSGPDRPTVPTSIGDMLDSLKEVINSHKRHEENMKALEITDEHPDKVYKTYEKPY